MELWEPKRRIEANFRRNLLEIAKEDINSNELEN